MKKLIANIINIVFYILISPVLLIGAIMYLTALLIDWVDKNK